MNSYRSINLVPPLVKRAKNLAGQMNYTTVCSDGTGRLLRMLSHQFQSGMIGEIGSGCGVGSAWITSALAAGTSFITVEDSPTLSAVARTLFEEHPSVKVLHAEWHDIVKYGPFNLVYLSASRAKDCAQEVLLEALRIGGTIVIDGLVPVEQMTPEQQSQPDALRSAWLDDPRLLATEILVSASEAVLLATRVD